MTVQYSGVPFWPQCWQHIPVYTYRGIWYIYYISVVPNEAAVHPFWNLSCCDSLCFSASSGFGNGQQGILFMVNEGRGQGREKEELSVCRVVSLPGGCCGWLDLVGSDGREWLMDVRELIESIYITTIFSPHTTGPPTIVYRPAPKRLTIYMQRLLGVKFAVVLILNAATAASTVKMGGWVGVGGGGWGGAVHLVYIWAGGGTPPCLSLYIWTCPPPLYIHGRGGALCYLLYILLIQTRWIS